MNYITIKRLIVLVLALIPFTALAYSDYKCFIEPMDQYPDNRVNILPTLGTLQILHVEIDDRKTLLADPLFYEIWSKKVIQNMETYEFSNGVFAVDKSRNNRGLHTGMYIHKNDGNDAGYHYNCERVEIIYD
mgnify:FL=1|jgi:hypothetical protein